MKEQGKNPSDQTNEDKIGNLPEKEFSHDSKDDPKSWKQCRKYKKHLTRT